MQQIAQYLLEWSSATVAKNLCCIGTMQADGSAENIDVAAKVQMKCNLPDKRFIYFINVYIYIYMYVPMYVCMYI
jgi:hypothetical protein